MYKSTNQSGTKLINWDSSRPTSIRRKYVRLINVGSNKVCVVSLTNFLIFLNYVNLNQFWEKNN